MAVQPHAAAEMLTQAELEVAVCRALRCDRAALQRLDREERSGSVSDGFMSDTGGVAVRAVVAGGEPRSVRLFVKRADADSVANDMDCFGREGLYYELVRPVLAEAWEQPQGATGGEDLCCDPADLGPEAFLRGDRLLVLDDLTARGYHALPDDWPCNGMDLNTLQQVLRALARLHAASLVAERRRGVRFAALSPELLHEPHITRRAGAMGRRINDTGADTVADYLLPALFSSLAVPQTAETLRRLQDEVRDTFGFMDVDELRHREAVAVVLHGDAWPNNVLVRTDDKGVVQHVALVDYPFSALGPPAVDVLHFLVTATRRDFRRKHMDGLLAHYHACLAEYCRQRGLDLDQMGFGLQAFEASVRRAMPIGLCLSAVHKSIVAGRKEDIAAFHTDADAKRRLLCDAAYRGPLLAGWLAAPPDDNYHPLVQEVVEELLGLPPAAEASAAKGK